MIGSNENGVSQHQLLVMKEYESIVETLTTQVEFYANEQENLRKEISALINENKLLGQTIQELLLENQWSTEKDNQQKRTETELVTNLKAQLNLTLKEKDTVVQLWQNALKNIDHLEEELKLFEGRTHGYFPKIQVTKIRQRYENKIADLEGEILKYHSQLDALTKESSKSLENKNSDLKRALETLQHTNNLVKGLETEVKQLEVKLQEITDMRDTLQVNLDTKNYLIEELKSKDLEAKAKVTEAIHVVEAAFLEKDAALAREIKAKEEVVKMSKTLSEVLDESAVGAKNKIQTIKEEHNLEMQQIQQNIHNLKEELNSKNIQLEKCTKESKMLEEDLERIRKGSICTDEDRTTKILSLEKNLESTFQKLLLSERKNLQVTSEKECLKADLDQMANYYKNDIKMREVEKQVLQHEIQTLQKQLKMSTGNLIQVRGEMDKVKAKIKLIDMETRDTLQSKQMTFRQAISKAIEVVRSENAWRQNELQMCLESQIALNKRWMEEVYEIINIFEKCIQELKEANKSLRKKLKQAVNDGLLYRNSLTNFCKDVTNVEINTELKTLK